MKINIKNPIVYSLLYIVITFIIILIILSTLKPSYIKEVDKNGKIRINISLLLVISLLFAVLIGIINFLFFSKKYISVKNNIIVDQISYIP